MQTIAKEYLLLFNTLTDAEETLHRLEARLMEAQRQGSIRIRRHCNIIEGHILPDRPKKRRGK